MLCYAWLAQGMHYSLQVEYCSLMMWSSRKRILLQVMCDGEPLELPDDIEGVLILNINSYMGGVDLWASGVNSDISTKTGKQSLCDGMLEVSLPCIVHSQCTPCWGKHSQRLLTDQ